MVSTVVRLLAVRGYAPGELRGAVVEVLSRLPPSTRGGLKVGAVAPVGVLVAWLVSSGLLVPEPAADGSGGASGLLRCAPEAGVASDVVMAGAVAAADGPMHRGARGGAAGGGVRAVRVEAERLRGQGSGAEGEQDTEENSSSTQESRGQGGEKEPAGPQDKDGQAQPDRKVPAPSADTAQGEPAWAGAGAGGRRPGLRWAQGRGRVRGKTGAAGRPSLPGREHEAER